MTTVSVIRHGRASLNADGAPRGRVDIPLDEVGLAEAARLGERSSPRPGQATWRAGMRSSVEAATDSTIQAAA
jgi:probable phosphoglycerate mutase